VHQSSTQRWANFLQYVWKIRGTVDHKNYFSKKNDCFWSQQKIKEEGGGMVYLLTIRARSLTISDVVESRLLWACLLRHNEPGSLQSASCTHPFWWRWNPTWAAWALAERQVCCNEVSSPPAPAPPPNIFLCTQLSTQMDCLIIAKGTFSL
jgi:hypothetical protein